MQVHEEPVVTEQTFAVSRSELWDAITSPEKMQQWFFEDMESFEPTVGFQTRFTVDNEGTQYIHVWTVTQAETEKCVSYDWRYEGMEGNSNVTWEISDTPEGVCLKLTHKVLESFNQDDANFKRESCQDGWDYFIKQNLPSFLAG